MVNDSFNWYVLYTKPRWEKKVNSVLSKRKIESYCPLNRVLRQWSDRKKIVFEPLFKSYVFVRIQQSQLAAVRLTGGVINFVYWLGKPAVVRHFEIDEIKRFMDDHMNVQLERIEVELNDKVMVNSGPLMHREGNVIELRHRTVRVKLSSLGYAMIAEIDKAHIEKISFIGQNHEEAYHSTDLKIAKQ
jgi:transcription antitermination factor NusG